MADGKVVFDRDGRRVNVVPPVAVGVN
jgi:hypothetical protein